MHQQIEDTGSLCINKIYFANNNYLRMIFSCDFLMDFLSIIDLAIWEF